MPSKSEVLGALNRGELQDAAQRFEIEVQDRRVKDQLVEALGRSRTAKLDEILGALPRDRLKELCRGFGLDDSGKEKKSSGTDRAETADTRISPRGITARIRLVSGRARKAV